MGCLPQGSSQHPSGALVQGQCWQDQGMGGHAQQSMDFNALSHNTRLDSGVKGAIGSPTATKDVQRPL